MKEFLIVGIGSFFGGGMRYLVAKWLGRISICGLPWGTMTVNVAGCLIIGLLSALPWVDGVASRQTRLLLTTGFCGGFTTFSTFVNEGASLSRDGQIVGACVYTVASVLLGFLAVWAGYRLGRTWQ